MWIEPSKGSTIVHLKASLAYTAMPLLLGITACDDEFLDASDVKGPLTRMHVPRLPVNLAEFPKFNLLLGVLPVHQSPVIRVIM